MAAVTLDQMLAWLRAGDLEANDKTLLQEHLNSALGMVAEIVGNLDHTETTVRVYPTASGYIRMPFPIDSTASVTVADPNGTTVTADDVDYEAGVIDLGTAWTTRKAWTVTATPAAPATSVLLAVKIIASHLFDVHRGKSNTTAGAQPWMQSADDLVPPSGFAMPRRAQELLAPYARGPFA